MMDYLSEHEANVWPEASIQVDTLSKQLHTENQFTMAYDKEVNEFLKEGFFLELLKEYPLFPEPSKPEKKIHELETAKAELVARHPFLRIFGCFGLIYFGLNTFGGVLYKLLSSPAKENFSAWVKLPKKEFVSWFLHCPSYMIRMAEDSAKQSKYFAKYLLVFLAVLLALIIPSLVRRIRRRAIADEIEAIQNTEIKEQNQQRKKYKDRYPEMLDIWRRKLGF